MAEILPQASNLRTIWIFSGKPLVNATMSSLLKPCCWIIPTKYCSHLPRNRGRKKKMRPVPGRLWLPSKLPWTKKPWMRWSKPLLPFMPARQHRIHRKPFARFPFWNVRTLPRKQKWSSQKFIRMGPIPSCICPPLPTKLPILIGVLT